ncbi:MAG: thiamine-monophosphate kinase, partial [Planctomycetes bacterium]|nr:thiamine-monophosphate kinase [Planctomycetota bacterium]
MKSRELDHIAWIRKRVGADGRVPVGIGDDAAVLLTGAERILITTDMLLEGVHF